MQRLFRNLGRGRSMAQALTLDELVDPILGAGGDGGRMEGSREKFAFGRRYI